MAFLAFVVDSKITEGKPINSFLIRKPTTVNSFRIRSSFRAIKSAAFSTPIIESFAVVLRPIPQIFPTGKLLRTLSMFTLSESTQQPRISGSFLAKCVAIFAKVFVGATPILTGIPTCLYTIFRISIACSSMVSSLPFSNSKNASSIE